MVHADILDLEVGPLTDAVGKYVELNTAHDKATKAYQEAKDAKKKAYIAQQSALKIIERRLDAELPSGTALFVENHMVTLETINTDRGDYDIVIVKELYKEIT